MLFSLLAIRTVIITAITTLLRIFDKSYHQFPWSSGGPTKVTKKSFTALTKRNGPLTFHSPGGPKEVLRGTVPGRVYMVKEIGTGLIS